MAFIVDESGNITLIQGDSGHITVSGIQTDKEYIVYLAIQDKRRNPMWDNELYKSTNINGEFQDTVDFFLTGSLTDVLTVPRNQETETYYYAIKICSTSDNTEDTVSLDDNDISIYNTIIVYPKRVEGLINA